MNCAWHGENDESGTHGICDDCMAKYFGVDAKSIHDEIEAEKVPVASVAIMVNITGMVRVVDGMVVYP